jgi:hypothetical protein
VFAGLLRRAQVVRYSRKGRTGTIENSIRFTGTPFFVWDKKTVGFATKPAQPLCTSYAAPCLSGLSSLRLSSRVVRTNHCERTWPGLMMMFLKGFLFWAYRVLNASSESSATLTKPVKRILGRVPP